MKIQSIASVLAVASAVVPLAPCISRTVDKGSYVEFKLTGYDLDGDSVNNPISASITSLPTTGTLYHLSQVYNDYGYEPKLGEAVKLNDKITSTNRRLIYQRPENDYPASGKWDEFKYKIDDGTVLSAEGTITVTDKSTTTVDSDFATGLDGWTISGNTKATATYEPSSRGAMSYYVYNTDDNIQVDASGSDTKQWHFQAPAKFLGWQGNSYGGALKFTLSSSTGDFSAGNQNSALNLVDIYCASCAQNNGIHLVYKSPVAFDGSTTAFTVPLTEKSWLKDPKNTLVAWEAPQQCEFIDMLAHLSSLSILGDHTKWYETVALDSVRLSTGRKLNPFGSLPIECTCSTKAEDAIQYCDPATGKLRQDHIVNKPVGHLHNAGTHFLVPNNTAVGGASPRR
jgi:hypothetical protein